MNRIIFWIGIFLIVLSMLYLVSNTLAPFIIAFIFAYLLQPAIDSNCNRFNLPRNLITFGVFSVFISSFILIIVLVIPVIYDQSALFINNLPKYKGNFDMVISKLLEKLYSMDIEIADKVSDFVKSFVNTAFSIVASFANNLWDYTLATINFFVIIALVPIILYYFLRDWPKMVSSLESMLPVKGKSKVRKIINSVNELLSAYIRGQLNICLALSIYYTIGLSLIGLDLALLFGVISGFLIIIPFIGPLVSFFVVAISCYFSFGVSAKLIYTVILFIVGHVIEGFILTPKIIGNRIGLHPVWILFAVFAGGSLFGFIGVLFAIPMAGVIKVLLNYIIEYYKSSNIYNK